MASSQAESSTQIKGEIFNKLNEILHYDFQHVWGGTRIEHPNEVQKHSQMPFSQHGLGVFGSNCKGALVYRFAIQRRAPQYWVFAWHSPVEYTNKAFTMLYYNKDDINWDMIEKELDSSTNESKYAEGGVLVRVAVPSEGICNASIEYLPLNN